MYLLNEQRTVLPEFRRIGPTGTIISPRAGRRSGGTDWGPGVRNSRLRVAWICTGTAFVLDIPCTTSGPPIKIERVDVSVRLEKRLAALLLDLAQHKRMSVNSCLEEILLHTNEGVEPHTKATLRQIEELKKKHGIDYDSHGSYRFVERVGPSPPQSVVPSWVVGIRTLPHFEFCPHCRRQYERWGSAASRNPLGPDDPQQSVARQ